MSETGEGDQNKPGKLHALRNAFHVATSHNYDQNVNPKDYERFVLSIGRETTAHDIGDVIEQHIPIQNSDNQRSTVLDVASGTGILARDLFQRRYNVVASDLSQIALEYLKSQTPDIRTQIADMNEAFPFDDNSFEGVTTLWANRYIKDPKRFLEEVQRILRPGGAFVWPVFAIESPFWKINSGFRQPTSVKSLAQQAQGSGFREVSVIHNPFYANLLRRGVRRSATPSFVVATK